MICSRFVVGQLFLECAIEVVVVSGGVIQKPDQNVGQLNLGHLAVREMVVLKVATFAFQHFGNFGVDQAQKLELVTLQLLARRRIVPPMPIGGVNLFAS